MSDPSELSLHSNFKLPPIGFEEYNYANQEVKPLKKKKRTRSRALKNIQLAVSGFKGSNSEQPQSVSIHSPPEFHSGRHLKTRTAPSKRFTLTDLDPNINLQQYSGKMMSKDVAATLRELYSKPELQRTDYVLVYHKPDPEDEQSAETILRQRKRMRFHKMLEKDGFDVDEVEVDDKTVFVKLQCTFRRLCREAERMRLMLPLKDMEVKDPEPDCCTGFEDWIDRTFVTDNEADFVSAQFQQSKLHLFENSDKPDLFFRSALRGLLTNHILKNIDLRDLPKTAQYYYHADDDDDPDEDILAKQGLPFLILKKVYVDAFTLHDESSDQIKEVESHKNIEAVMNDSVKLEQSRTILDENTYVDKIIRIYGDARHELNMRWPKVFKFQPLWKVRNYFGEEIAMYFALIGLMVFSLVLPMLMGLGVSGYGLFKSVITAESYNVTIGQGSSQANSTGIQSLVEDALRVLDIIKAAFDNEATPFYSIAICVWCTIFLEMWKRKNAVLAYEWDVSQFDEVEPDRPEYYGTLETKDPVTGERVKFYPFRYRCLKYSVSLVTFLFMVIIVICVMLSVVIYRVILNVDYCSANVNHNGTITSTEKLSGSVCFIVTTVCSSVLNAIVIMILGRVYDKLARLLTRWENHRTDSAFRNALIVKLFAFQFVNNYSSLYYIAFFRNTQLISGAGSGIFGLSAKYADSCGDGSYGNTCMSQLSFQVLALMIIKPFPKFLWDVIMPWSIRLFRKYCCKKKSTVDPEQTNPEPDPELFFLQQEKNKPQLYDFTLGEYTEKVIQYGLLTLFAAAMPLGPLIVVITNLLDRYVDSKRLLWQYRRPIANIAQDIGMWYPILEFVNIAAVITNGFLIAYVSSFGSYYSAFWPDGYGYDDKLWTVLVFEHLVFGLKYLLGKAIPDVPQRVRLAIRKEKYTVARILDIGKFTKDLTEDLALDPTEKASKRTIYRSSETTTRGVDSHSIKESEGEKRSRVSAMDKDSELNHPSSRTNKHGSVALEYGSDGDSYIRT